MKVLTHALGQIQKINLSDSTPRKNTDRYCNTLITPCLIYTSILCFENIAILTDITKNFVLKLYSNRILVYRRAFPLRRQDFIVFNVIFGAQMEAFSLKWPECISYNKVL